MKSSFLMLFILFSYCFSTSLFGQSNNSALIQTVNISCENEILTIYIPKGYESIDTFNYMEGFIQSFSYSDGSSISILCGANATLSCRQDQADDLYFRKIKFKHHDMTYDNVKTNKKKVFDQAFDMMENK